MAIKVNTPAEAIRIVMHVWMWEWLPKLVGSHTWHWHTQCETGNWIWVDDTWSSHSSNFLPNL